MIQALIFWRTKGAGVGVMVATLLPPGAAAGLTFAVMRLTKGAALLIVGGRTNCAELRGGVFRMDQEDLQHWSEDWEQEGSGS